MIKIEDLSFSYPKASRKNLDHLHVEFPEQTVNMIIGKNGSGKTTLFDLIANVIKRPPEIQGIPDEKEIIYQLQGLLFPLTLKAKDLFRFFLYSDHSNRIEVNNVPYVDEAMSPAEVELVQRVWHMEFGQLSVGERRYLCILAITLMKRKLYIFDEPLAGIDPEMRYHILKRIEKLALHNECTVLVSNHHLHDIANIQCVLHFIHQGKITFSGSYETFIEMGDGVNPDLAFLEQMK
ncbi:ATP-binding cassette domain-containing protein [Paenibacillus polysaccharolyticus]|uniref:ATP-binding cassette domain-containing protein n=1 Tax=Paenibacillus polysaccharolyticus TaxID=582692 RepID=UPI003009C157